MIYKLVNININEYVNDHLVSDTCSRKFNNVILEFDSEPSEFDMRNQAGQFILNNVGHTPKDFNVEIVGQL